MLLNILIKKNFFFQRFQSTIDLTRAAIASQPLEWNDLIKWFENGQKTLLCRSDECAQRYIQHQKFVENQYRSINDYIRIHYLKWNFDIDKLTSKRFAIPSPNSIKEPLLTPNDFPYYLVSDIKHWLIWADPIPEEPVKVIDKIIEKEFPCDRFQRLSFVNPPRLRSVSDVFHAHVFTREINK